MRTVPIIDTSRIVAVKTATASPTKRDIRYAKEAHSLIDLTEGKAVKSVLYLDSGQIILSADSVGMFVKYFPNQKVTYHTELFLQKKRGN